MKMLLLRSILPLLLIAPAVRAVDLSSPDGRLQLSLDAPDGHLSYRVLFRGKEVLQSSALRLQLQGQPPLGAAVRILASQPSSGESTYTLLAGKTSAVHDRYNALVVKLEEPAAPHRKLEIEARAYDEAVAFRYVVPEQHELKDFRLASEHTEFNFVHDATTWSLVLPNYRSMYESEYIKLPISAFANQGGVGGPVLIGLPNLVHLPGIAWVGITEADLRDYSSMYLAPMPGGWACHGFESRLAPRTGDPTLCVTGSLPHHSPWRVLLVADEPGRLIESNAITSLNPECAVPDTSWIKPGKASWDWWCGSIGPDGKPAYTTETMRYYVDFAAKSGFPYMLLDAGWSAHGDITRMNGKVDVPSLCSYAAQKNVKVWIWLYYGSTAKQMEQAFPLYEKWGVAGVKIDFISSDDQDAIDWYYRTAELAARHHLMVDFHGATKPTGLERTFPNVLGYEAVLGIENSKVGVRDNPDNRSTIAFTRMMVGPADYTPGGFRNATAENFVARSEHPMVLGTRAQQLAMYVVCFAPFEMVSDEPTAYDNQPGFDFIKEVPTAWDQTRVLAGRPGEFIVTARRHGQDWYLGALTSWTPRDLEIPLDFLPAGQYLADTYADGPDAARVATSLTVASQPVSRGAVLKLHLAPGGGFAARLRPAAAQSRAEP